jgi:Flp pilus assembly CpaE family ATPase
MGAQTLIYGLKPHTGLSDLCADPHRVDPLFLSRSTENIMQRLDLLAADGGAPGDAHLSTEKLGKLFDIIQSKYHFIISDLPRNFCTNEEVSRSDYAQIIVVFDRRLSSLRNLQQFTNEIEKANSNTEIILVLNDVRPALKTDFPLQKISEVISEQIDMIIPYDGRGFSQSQVAAKPITEMRSCAGDRIRNLAEKLANQRSSGTRTSFLAPIIRRFKNV